MIQPLLTLDDLAEVLKLNKNHVADRVTRRKDFPKPYQIGGARRWKEEDVLQWLEERKI